MKYGDIADFWDAHDKIHQRGVFVGWCAAGEVSETFDADGNDKIYLCRLDNSQVKRYAFMRGVTNKENEK